MKTMLISLCFSLLVLVIGWVLLSWSYSSRGAYKGAISDHFDGKKFYNTGIYQKKALFSVVRWWWTGNKKAWPAHVENLPHPTLTALSAAQNLKATFINHATVLLQTKELNLLTDPIWSYRASPFTWLGPARVRLAGIDFAELPKIDVVLISHNHYDHMDIDSLIKLNNQFHPVFIVPLGNKYFLNKKGIENVVELDWWQTYSLKKTIITLLPAQHWSARWIDDRYATLWGSYGIDTAHQKIYFGGDAGYSNHFAQIRERWGRPNLSFLPIGAYEPEWFMRQNHLNPEEAVKAHIDLQSQQSIGIHFGTFQLSDEAIDAPVKALNAAKIKYHLNEQDFFVLREGESRAFD